MVKVAGVRFKPAGKVYYFDPDNLEIHAGCFVVVETARGVEFGTVTSDIKELPEDKIVAPLKKMVRLATKDDEIQHEENEKKKRKAMQLCQDKVEKHKLDMKLVDVEYTFDGTKIVFYFTAEGRIDFRDLVKDLAGIFKMRIELRQIGVRDESKMVGGIGNCGKGICCNTWLSEFQPVSIKMAKVQNLSLNPTKISGVCGRLMCCLKYENDTYIELKKGMPEVGEKIRTPEGMGVVTDSNILENKVKVRLVVEEKTDDKAEKLTTELHVFTKEEIKRLGPVKKVKGGDMRKNADKEEELPEEIIKLLND